MSEKLIVSPLLTEEESARWNTAADLEVAAAYHTPRRRQEVLTWRALVRREVGRDVEIGYNAVGAPQLIGATLQLSVSHCVDRVAVALSQRRCAVDVERTDRNFERVADRYITVEERALSADPRWPGVVWCAKETLYKYAGRTELDLLRDLSLVAADLTEGWVLGKIKEEEPIRLSLCFEDSHTLVSIL